MKRLLLILILTFSFQTLAKADDIKDFQIEGMSIGDSALDYFSKDQITKNSRNYYKNKVEKLHVKSENLFVLWSEMEQKYAEQLSKGKLKNKEIVRNLISERKRYKEQLNSIKQDLQIIMSNVQKKRMQPNLA